MDRQTSGSDSPVRQLREARGLSREGLAFKAGVSLKTIERIEAGDVEPRRATLAVIARVLGVKPEELAASGPEPMAAA